MVLLCSLVTLDASPRVTSIRTSAAPLATAAAGPATP
jgi:hypothetical protein